MHNNEAAAQRLRNGGRLVCAGTSGRVALHDGIELGAFTLAVANNEATPLLAAALPSPDRPGW